MHLVATRSFTITPPPDVTTTEQFVDWAQSVDRDQNLPSNFDELDSESKLQSALDLVCFLISQGDLSRNGSEDPNHSLISVIP